MAIDATITTSVPVSTSTYTLVGVVAIAHIVPVVVTGSIFKQSVGSALAPAAPRQRYPAIPSDAANPAHVLDAVRERVEIFSRDRGNILDSFIRVEDLLQLGIIKPEDVEKLSKR